MLVREAFYFFDFSLHAYRSVRIANSAHVISNTCNKYSIAILSNNRNEK
jgi:hypothetical protein